MQHNTSTTMKFICIFALLIATLSSKAQSPESARDTTIYKKVDTAAAFPNGDAAWQAYLRKHFTYSKEAMKNEIQGTVIVQYVIEMDGSVTNVTAISGPTVLRQDAENSIKQSPKWTPAVKAGIKVRSYKMQPIVFRLNS